MAFRGFERLHPAPSIYIAAPFELQERAALLASRLDIEHMIRCTARWLKDDDAHDDLERMKRAEKDLRDIAAADVVVVLSDEYFRTKGTGGRHVELGYALGKRKPIVLIGPRTNVFHHLPQVVQLPEGASLTQVAYSVRRLAHYNGV